LQQLDLSWNRLGDTGAAASTADRSGRTQLQQRNAEATAIAPAAMTAVKAACPKGCTVFV